MDPMKIFVFSLYSILLFSSCVDPAAQRQGSSPANSLPPPAPPTVQATAVPPPTGDAKLISDKIRAIVAKHLELSVTEVDANTPLSKLKRPADALDVVEIIMTVEEAFNIEIKDDELGGSDIDAVTNITVDDLAGIVAKRKSGK